MVINIFSQQKDMYFLSERQSGNEVFIFSAIYEVWTFRVDMVGMNQDKVLTQ